LKGEYKVNCADESGSDVADHCRYYALSDPSKPLFQESCDHQHDKRCDDCDKLRNALTDSSELLKTVTTLHRKRNQILSLT
jgi:hypothetical protein